MWNIRGISTGLLSTLLMVCLGNVRAQTAGFERYQPLACGGQMPGEFNYSLAQWQKQFRFYKAGSGNDSLISDKIYTEQNGWFMMKALYSGSILFGDPLTAYINRVADTALKGDPHLRKSLRFYLLRSTDFNAFSTQSGIIFVTTGLLARIENEAQLAYILCHEAAHFAHNHNYNAYRFRSERALKAKEKKKKRQNPEMSLTEYSRQHELQADSTGIELYRKSPYSTGALDRVFTVMLYSYLPFAEIPFDTTYFNSGAYRLPDRLFPVKKAALSAEEDVPDTGRTHPNILKRREAVRRIIGTPAQDGLLNPCGKGLFEQMQKTARYECAHLYLEEGETEEAFYAAYLLEKVYGGGEYVSEIMSASLYLAAKQKNNKKEQYRVPFNRAGSTKRINTGNAYWETIEGESQAVYYMFSQLTPRECSILAMRVLYGNLKRYGDEFFRKRFLDLASELNTKHLMNAHSFYAPGAPGQTQLPAWCEQRGNCDSLRKTDERNNRNIQKACELGNYSNKSYFLYAFESYYYDELMDTLWRNRYPFREIVTVAPGHVQRRVIEKRKRFDFFTEKRNKSTQKADSFLLMQPYTGSWIIHYPPFGRNYYYVPDPKVSPAVLYNRSLWLAAQLGQAFQQKGLTSTLIRFGSADSMTTENFNRYLYARRWLAQRTAPGNADAFVYHDAYPAGVTAPYRYVVMMEMITIGKILEFDYVVYDLHTGRQISVLSEERKNGKPGDKRSLNMIRKAVRMTVDGA